jgi:CheY-like chemotaxis protein
VIAAPIHTSHPRRRILVVDDEPDILFTLKMVLGEIGGYDVTSEEYPRQALTGFTTKSYDLLVLDIRMPDINGFELYRQMSKKRKMNKDTTMTSVCFLTALDDLADYKEYKLEACPSLKERRYFVKKPVDNEELLERVKDMIEA